MLSWILGLGLWASAFGAGVSNDNFCATVLNAPRAWYWTEADGERVFRGGKRAYIESQLPDDWSGEEEDVARLSALYDRPPFTATAGPFALEITRGAVDAHFRVEMIARTGDHASRVVRILAKDFLDRPLAGSATGRHLLVSDRDQRLIRLIDLEHGIRTLEFGDGEDPVYAEFSADGLFLIAQASDYVDVFDLVGLRPRKVRRLSFRGLETTEQTLRRGSINYLPRNDALIVHYADGPPRWLKAHAVLEDEALRSPHATGVHNYGITDWSATKLFSVRSNFEIDEFELPSRKYIKTLYASTPVRGLALSPDGRYLAYASPDDAGVGVFDLLAKSPTVFVHIEVPSGSGSLIHFGSPRELLVGATEFAELFAFKLP